MAWEARNRLWINGYICSAEVARGCSAVIFVSEQCAVMVRMAIASELFRQRGPLNKATLSSLHVRGGGVQVDDALGRWGWGGMEPVVTTVINIDHATAVVRGTRYETRGSLESPVKIKASELWPGAAEGVEVHLKLTNLGIINWVTQGDVRNISHWVEDKEIDHVIINVKDNVAVLDEDKEENGIFDFVLRFTILPADVEKSLLYASILPYSKAVLKDKLQAVNKTLDSPVIPTLPLKLFKSSGKMTNAHPLTLLPKERPGDRFGLGHLPLLEVVGDGRPNFPPPRRNREGAGQLPPRHCGHQQHLRAEAGGAVRLPGGVPQVRLGDHPQRLARLQGPHAGGARGARRSLRLVDFNF